MYHLGISASDDRHYCGINMGPNRLGGQLALGSEADIYCNLLGYLRRSGSPENGHGMEGKEGGSSVHNSLRRTFLCLYRRECFFVTIHNF